MASDLGENLLCWTTLQCARGIGHGPMLEVAHSLPAGAMHNETMAQVFIIKGQNHSLFWGRVKDV